MILDMKNIAKRFGATQALSGVNLHVGEGEIHGLLGENGAGKSTLMNILAGIFPPTAGEIYIDGELITKMTAKKAGELGIRFIHQELNLVNDLTVFENLFLGEEINRNPLFLDKKQMIEKARVVLEDMKLDINPLEMVENLDTSQKQLVEIAKALLFDCRLIIMDEPTTALTNKEIENLFILMRQLKERGVSMIYISHKMPELFEICDCYTVFRDGKFIQTGAFKDIDEKIATSLLVGKKIIDEKVEVSPPAGDEIILETKDLCCEPYFKDISIQLRKGEVIAITGLHGDGRGELAETLFGARRATDGAVFLKGKELPRGKIKQTMQAGIGMVPRNRKERSIIKDMSILDNMFIADFVHKKGPAFIRNKKLEMGYEKSRQVTDIKAGSSEDLITSLSGGNQQKVILSRWLEVNPDVYILDNPTQGIDVGAKFEIYNIIRRLANEGKSIIMFSAEFPEIYQVANRCLVMYKGQVNAELNRDEMTEISVMYYATGANQEDRK